CLKPLAPLHYRVFCTTKPTTYDKLLTAVEINDLIDESPLEDRLWAELKRLEIGAERQEVVQAGSKSYFLDFAIYCAKGNLNVETDGDTWHNNPQQVEADKLRDNALKVKGWHTLRFTTKHVREKMASYCLPTITDTINGLGGLGTEGKLLLQVTHPPAEGQAEQLNLFNL
ncbi:MAG: endonuclease domain-containing protein, partial [Prochlorothrix sp.]